MSDVVGIRAAAAITGLYEKKIRVMAHKGVFPYLRDEKGFMMFSRAALERWAQAHPAHKREGE